MRVPIAACSAALSGSLVLAMIGSAVGVDEPGLPALSVRAARTVVGVPLAVPTTPPAPVDTPPQAATGATYAAATAAQLIGGP